MPESFPEQCLIEQQNWGSFTLRYMHIHKGAGAEENPTQHWDKGPQSPSLS